MSNMDNQTKILVNKIYERMQTVDKSIDDKSNKLFKIRDELANLSEQARMMQYEINQLSTEQAENMSEFLLLCEYLDTYPKWNSNPGNITPNKVVGDVPLALSAKNISTVSKDMPNPKSKDAGKSLAIEKSKDATSSKEEQSTSSVKDEKIISGNQKLENRIQKKKNNLAFTRYIYNLQEES
ncbi:hypothetical protein KY289_035655 [Solanum tuberosum]|nr:hypothetical protein KY289_035655 [Solanum tuberosum]